MATSSDGFYVEPTVVGDLPPRPPPVPRTSCSCRSPPCAAVDSLDEAIELANDSVYGLTAGVYSEDPAEVEQFLDAIEAGVVYVNRRAGRDDRRVAGRPAVRRLEGLGHHRQGRPVDVLRPAQFLREQSQTVVD